MLPLLGLFPLFTSVVNAGLPAPNCNTDLYIVDKTVQPDGFSRSAVVAGSNAQNGAIVGPLIAGLKGGKYNIQVHNQLTNPDLIKGTSIHWHGLLQKGSGWADGPAFVNQCPISPGQTFAYQFSTADQAGTFWYHSHIGLQYCDGLRGPFVVYDPQDPQRSLYDIDDASTVITISDWYHVLAKDLAGPTPPDATLINGVGRYKGGPAVPLAVVTVKRGVRYRFRLVSMSCDAHHVFQINGHDLTVIEADGTSTSPYTVRSIDIFAGQRYSFVLNANQAVGNYWIRSNPPDGNFVGGQNSAILRYIGAPAVEPPPNQMDDPMSGKGPLLETSLHPLTATVLGSPRIGGADVNLNLLMGIDPVALAYTFNGATWRPPSLPILNQILSGASTAQQLLPADSIIELPKNKVIEVSMPGGAPSSPHPMHLHGHRFQVVRSAGSQSYNYKNPIMRDVVSTGDVGDNVTIRFKTDNAGAWFLHCHIDPHLELGLAVVFAEALPDIKASTKPPKAWQDLCPLWAQQSGDSARLASGNVTNKAYGGAVVKQAKADGFINPS